MTIRHAALGVLLLLLWALPARAGFADLPPDWKGVSLIE
jgi:hypothetical protein